ncbi:hypothetical protein [uncultured Tateyamaria sp.]|uniref:hypothetical protein n=1 Tax=uncultured Tateyamaria sp. TaxID=455651 RepID=UPI0026149D0C|nr:hypothetical protein [uncultured Tateyamaria sp.]
MRCFAFIALIAMPFVATAQTADELFLFGAMVEGPEGTPVATATAIGGEPGNLVFVTGRAVAETPGICVKTWEQSACHSVTSYVPMPGHDTLALISIAPTQEEMNAKFANVAMTRQPLTSTYDPASADGLSFMTQNALGGWERPLALATPSGRSGDQVILRSDAFNTLSIGAPVSHPTNGLVGLIARAGDGSGALLPIADALRATQAAGVATAAWMMPAGAPDGGGLPPRVASEIGRMIIFHDYSDLGYIGGFYGPSQGTGFDESFQTVVSYSVWQVDLNGGGGTRIAQIDRTVPLVPVGMAMEAPFTGRPGDHLATCVTHATPSSGGRPVFVVQFWRSVPERYNPNTDSKDYDQAASPMLGWADGETHCIDALRQMGTDRLAALANGTAAFAEETIATSNAGSSAPSGTWQSRPNWDATGRDGQTFDLGDGITLTTGCTASKERVVAIEPGVTLTAINGQVPMDGPNGIRFVLLAPSTEGSLALVLSGDARTLSLPAGTGTCE